MIRFLLYLFGYIKIPKEAVQLSYANQQMIKKEFGKDNDYYKGQGALTKFLRSGRLG